MALTQVTGGVIVSGVTITNPTISGYLNLPTWTTATRPSSPVTGTQGYNTTTGQIEVYNTTYAIWSAASTAPFYAIDYLVVAGGGGGGRYGAVS